MASRWRSVRVSSNRSSSSSASARKAITSLLAKRQARVGRPRPGVRRCSLTTTPQKLEVGEAPPNPLATARYATLQLGLEHLPPRELGDQIVRQLIRKDSKQLSRLPLHLFLSTW